MRLESRFDYKSSPMDTMAYLTLFFILLVIFMVSTSLDFQEGIKVDLPSARQAKLVSSDKLVVAVLRTQSGSGPESFSPCFNNRAVSWDRLEQDLASAVRERTLPFAGGRRPVLSLRVDKSTPYELVMRVLDIAMSLGVEVNLVTQSTPPAAQAAGTP